MKGAVLLWFIVGAMNAASLGRAVTLGDPGISALLYAIFILASGWMVMENIDRIVKQDRNDRKERP